MKSHHDISYSAFVIMPRTKDRLEFCVGRDNPDPERPFNQLLKTLGGGVEPGETVSEAAAKEISEETGQRIVNPTRRVAEIHKPSRTESQSHHDIFFESDPPLHDTPLVKGSEIAELAWKSKKIILQEIANRQFFPKHAAVMRWYFEREQIRTANGEPLIIPIIQDSRPRSWTLKNDVLILCFDPRCKESSCAPPRTETPIKQKPAIILPTTSPVLKSPVITASSHPCSFFIFYTDHFDDIVFVETKEEKLCLPLCRGPDGKHPACVTMFVARDPSSVMAVENEQKNIIIIQSPQKSFSDLTPLSLNDAPPRNLKEGCLDTIIEAIRAYNRTLRETKIAPHRLWYEY